MGSPLDTALHKPAHVPSSAVFNFDMFGDPELIADPHARLLDLVHQAPKIFWTPQNGGHWVIFGHDAVFAAARDTDAFSNEAIPHDQMLAMLTAMPPGAPRVPLPYPLMLDPPLHHKYRQPLQIAFSPKTVVSMKDEVRMLAATLLDGIAGAGGCEFMSAVAEPLPVQIFLKMFGLPVEAMPVYRALVKETLAKQSENSNPAESIHKMVKIAAIMKDDILARRDQPQDDVISMLWSLRIDDKPMTLDDMENYAVLLFIAGLDTVINGMGYAVRHLALHPELQARLRADLSLIPEASEEMLRRYSFVVVPRRVTRDVSFWGLEMKRDERVMLHLPAADLDPDVFPDPGRYDLDRANKSHIVFNAGPHRCLGAHLARVELQVLYEELLARLPPFRLDPDRPARYACSQILGMSELHLLWDH